MDQIFLRISLWLRRPPSRRQVWIMAVVVVLAGLLVGIEWMGWWPAWMHTNGGWRQPNFKS